MAPAVWLITKKPDCSTQGPSNLNQKSFLEDFVNFWRNFPHQSTTKQKGSKYGLMAPSTGLGDPHEGPSVVEQSHVTALTFENCCRAIDFSTFGTLFQNFIPLTLYLVGYPWLELLYFNYGIP